jgi:hypothetical protein
MMTGIIMDERPVAIRGGAGPMEAAAIVAVVQHVLEGEAAARAKPPGRNIPSAWVRVGSAQPMARYVPPVVPGS